MLLQSLNQLFRLRIKKFFQTAYSVTQRRCHRSLGSAINNAATPYMDQSNGVAHRSLHHIRFVNTQPTKVRLTLLKKTGWREDVSTFS